MKQQILGIFMLATVFGVKGQAPEPETREQVVEWLEKHAVAIDLQNPDQSFEFLDPQISQTTLVSIGEELHGVHEFLELKVVLTQYLVEKHNYRHIAIEDGVIKSQQINRLVQNRPPLSNHALNRFYWCWNTQEIQGLVGWIQSQNQMRNTQKTLSFAGVDCQSASGALDVLAKLTKATTASAAVTHLRNAFRAGRKSYSKRGADDHVKDLKSIGLLQEWLRGYRQVADITDITAADQALMVVTQNQHLWAQTETMTRMNLRDQYMAQNLLKTAASNQKIIFLAHNAHIGREPFYDVVKPIGAHLQETLKPAPLVIGALFVKGTVTADPRQKHPNGRKTIAADETKLSGILGEVALDTWAAVLDKSTMPPAVRSWFQQPPPGHFKNFADSPSLIATYDILFVFSNVSPAKVQRAN